MLKFKKQGFYMKKIGLMKFTTILMIPIAISFCNWGNPEKDPFITAKVKPVETTSQVSADDFSRLISSEPSFSKQFHFNHLNRGTIYDTYRGDGVTVAIIDSGLNTSHVDFFDGSNTNILDTSAYIEETGSTYSNIKIQKIATYGRSIIEDPLDNGHGTNVAGTIGAMVNGVGTAGVSPNVNLMILKTNYYFTEIDSAIRYAADNGADVINMSIGAYAETFTDGFGDRQEGISGADTYFQASIDYAYNKGVTLVAAAGNEKTNKSSYPASNNHVIGVGALSRNSSTSIASYSNYGTNNVDLVAPGSVYVADIGSSTSYVETQGTSFASPIVASAVALYKGKDASATPSQIENRLKESVFDLGEVGNDATYGYGRLDLTNLLVTDDIPVTGVTLSPSDLTLRVGETATIVASVSPSNATNKDVIYISNDESVAIVDENSGVVTATGVGTTQIGVLTDDGSFEDETNITVIGLDENINVDSIVIDEDNVDIAVNSSHTLSLSLSPKNALLSDLSFASSDSSIASVSESGVIIGHAIGSATITISAKIGTASASILVNVSNYKEASQTYSFSSSTWGARPENWQSVKNGNDYSNSGVQVTTGTTGASAISPHSFNNIQSLTIGYATNSSKGAGSISVYLLDGTTASAISNRVLVGTYSVTTTGGTTKRDTSAYIPKDIDDGYIQIEVKTTTNSIYICDIDIEYQEVVEAPIEVTGVTFQSENISLVEGETQQVIYEVLPLDATNKNVDFSSSNEEVATISSSGLISAHKQGTSVITVTTADGSYMDSLTLTVNVPITYEPMLTLQKDDFKVNYTFKEALDLEHLSATYRSSKGEITYLNGYDLTVASGGTSILGRSTLVFGYLEQREAVEITVTNVGSTSGGEVTNSEIALTANAFDITLTTTGTTYSGIKAKDMVFNAGGLRQSAGNLFIYTDGYLYNTNDLGNIQTIKFNYLEGGSASSYQDIRFASSAISSTSGISITQSITSSSGNTSMTVNAPAGSSYFRLDVSNKNLQANITITYQSGIVLQFTPEEQAIAYADYFMNLTGVECAAANVQAATWHTLQVEYQAMTLEAKALIKSSTDYEELLARYNIILGTYYYDDFVYDDSSSTGKIITESPANSNIMFLMVLISAGVVVGGLYSKKRRYR
jgi:uncharacterized protein YjdB